MKVFYLIIFTILFSCSRKVDVDEIALSETFFEENGYYYSLNCVEHSNYPKYTGKDTCYYDHGSIKSISNIVDGIPVGKWTKLNQKGNLKIELYYKDGEVIKKTSKKLEVKSRKLGTEKE